METYRSGRNGTDSKSVYRCKAGTRVRIPPSPLRNFYFILLAAAIWRQFFLAFLFFIRRCQTLHDLIIILGSVWKNTIGTHLYFLSRCQLLITRIARTLLQTIHRTIAKKTVEILPFQSTVTREIFAGTVFKKTVGWLHVSWFLSGKYFYMHSIITVLICQWRYAQHISCDNIPSYDIPKYPSYVSEMPHFQLLPATPLSSQANILLSQQRNLFRKPSEI